MNAYGMTPSFPYFITVRDATVCFRAAAVEYDLLFEDVELEVS